MRNIPELPNRVPLTAFLLSGILLAGALLTFWASPAAALNLKLGGQIAAGSNELTGQLPREGSWRGKFGPGVGLVAELDFTADVSVSFQPGLAQRNSRQVFESGGQVVGHFDYRNRYLTLPVLVRVTGDPVGTRGFVTAGLDLNILLDAVMESDAGEMDITDTYRPTTLGAMFGAGLLIPVGGSFLTVELRYDQGLDDIIVREGEEPELGLSGPSVKYRSLSLIAGFLFCLGGD